jgi:transcriptional regulator NrdR family protein
MAVIVKRRGKKEKFDEKKVYASVYSSCMDCDLSAPEAERIAQKMTDEVKKFIKGKKTVNSTQIFGFVIQKLAREHEAVAFMYETHREVVINN